METMIVSTGWLAFISIFNYFAPTWNKNDNNKIIKYSALAGN